TALLQNLANKGTALYFLSFFNYSQESKLQAYLPEYIYNVQRLVSGERNGFRYRFLAVLRMLAPRASKPECLPSMNVRKATYDRDEIAHGRYFEPGYSVARILGMVG